MIKTPIPTAMLDTAVEKFIDTASTRVILNRALSRFRFLFIMSLGHVEFTSQKQLRSYPKICRIDLLPEFYLHRQWRPQD